MRVLIRLAHDWTEILETKTGRLSVQMQELLQIAHSYSGKEILESLSEVST